MPVRKVRFVKGNIYHLYSRGNRKQIIFFRDSDYGRFLFKVNEYKKKYRVSVLAYCLMPNHFHLLIKQLDQIPVSRFIGTLLNSCARYVSIRYELPMGHVFQGRFGAKLIQSPESLLQVSRYIHLNPVKDKLLRYDITYKESRLINNKKLINSMRNYRWSSYTHYLQAAPTEDVNVEPILKIEGKRSKYRSFVESKISDEDILALERF